MNSNSIVLSKLIEEDFGLDTKEGSRWGKAEEHDSLVLDKERGIFFWNSENIAGDPLVYLTRVRKYTFEDAKEYLRNVNHIGTYVYMINGKEGEVVVYPELVEVFFSDGRSKRDYFYRRGLTDDTINRFQLGYFNGFNAIPIFEGGTFRNFQLRRDEPAKTIRNYYRGVGPLLFNSDILKLVDTIYYTEGPVDAMILSQNGLPAISSNGSTFKTEWYSKFIYTKRINILFDNDTAGVKEALRLANILGTTRCKIYTFEDFEDKGYDPVDFFRDGHTVDELKDLVYNKSKYSFEIGGKA